LKRWERVLGTIRGEGVDRVPLGELVMGADFCLQALGKKTFSFQAARDCWERFALDLVVLPPREEGKSPAGAAGCPGPSDPSDPWSPARWREETDCFVFALVNGGFSRALQALGFQGFMEGTWREPQRIKEALGGFFREAAAAARAAAARGAHGIMVGDDIAYQKGPFLSPTALRELYFPFLAELVEQLQGRGVAVFFHSDGNLNTVLADLVQAGIDGLQGLEPAAGMDLAAVKEKYGDKLCLMGNLDLSLLQPRVPDRDLRDAVRRTMWAGKPGGRFIFGTSGGLHGGLSAEKVEVMVQEAQRQGRYESDRL